MKRKKDVKKLAGCAGLNRGRYPAAARKPSAERKAGWRAHPAG